MDTSTGLIFLITALVIAITLYAGEELRRRLHNTKFVKSKIHSMIASRLIIIALIATIAAFIDQHVVLGFSLLLFSFFAVSYSLMDMNIQDPW